MSATSDELATQAEQLQTTIAFFKMEGQDDGRAPAARAEHQPARHKTAPPPPAAKRPAEPLSPAKRAAPRPAARAPKANGSSKQGVRLDLEAGSDSDELDSSYRSF
jgi:methyl-accepting chemotaxis protein